MRLYEYMSSKNDIIKGGDGPNFTDLLVLLEKDCKKFIRETGGFLYRATNRNIGSEVLYSKQTSRNNRRPVDTSRSTHFLADSLFKSEFGWKVRSEGVFTATYPIMTKGYGSNIYLVFPIGDFKYVWSEEATDFYITQSEYGSIWRNKDRSNLGVDLTRHFPKSVMQEIVKLYTNKNLNKAWDDGMSREIILKCPNGYYYVDYSLIGELSYYLDISVH